MRLIDADALKDEVNRKRVVGRFNTIQLIDQAPTIDDLSEYSDKLWQKAYERGKAEARKTGHWIKTISENGVTSAARCSECGFGDNRYMLFNFCPNCGADMRGGAE